MFSFGQSNKLSQLEANKQLESDENIVLIDVRDAKEYQQGHIKNAINIPMESVLDEIENVVKDKDQKIFVNCLSGGRSKASVSLILSKGYTQVFNIGGVATWEYGLVND